MHPAVTDVKPDDLLAEKERVVAIPSSFIHLDQELADIRQRAGVADESLKEWVSYSASCYAALERVAMEFRAEALYWRRRAGEGEL